MDTSSKSLQKQLAGKRVHILGIAGTLMGAFAAYLKRSGVNVTGSDQNIYPPMSTVLANEGIEVFTPFGAANLDRAQPDLVIVGNVIRKVNPEMEAVNSRGIPFQSLPDTLEKLVLPHKHPVVIAGTHGKTTTSSMMSWILEQLGEHPSFFIGGVVQNFTESFRITESKYMVLEGDEYDTAFFDKVPKFNHYKPKDVILTSVEYDHADIYPDMASLVSAFDKLARLTPRDGFFIACAETETTLRVAHKSDATVVTYGFSEGVDSRATHVEVGSVNTKFTWTMDNESTPVTLEATGRHNVLNALACLTLVRLRKLDVDKAVAALASFKGVKRRQEVYGQASGVTLIDDFAHHPTAVRETLSAMRAKYPSARIVACFEPRSATSRRKVFQAAYGEAFDVADVTYISKPYDQSGIQAADQVSTEELLEDLKSHGKRAKLLSTSGGGIKDFAGELKSGDVVVVMSNGGFDGLLPKVLQLLSQ